LLYTTPFFALKKNEKRESTVDSMATAVYAPALYRYGVSQKFGKRMAMPKSVSTFDIVGLILHASVADVIKMIGPYMF